MDKRHAVDLMEALHSLSTSMNVVAAKIETLPDEAEKQLLRRSIADMMGAHYTDLMLLILRQHPELDPDA